MSQITLVAIDLAKQSFHVRAVNHTGKAVVNRKVNREQLMWVVQQCPVSATIVMEACGTAHYWGRRFEAAGYKVKLIAPQYVKPFVKSQKNDSADAEGIAEAGSRASMRTIPVKSVEQQDTQSLHRVRERLVKSRTALMNELRGLLLEYGVVIPQGRSALSKCLSNVVHTEQLSVAMKALAQALYEELLELEKRLGVITKQVEQAAASNDICRRLTTIPGIAKISASAIYCATAHLKMKNGRQFAAFLGLVPRQTSTGGKEILGKITKRGDVYLRKLLVHGARSVLQHSHRRTDKYSSWVKSIRDSKGYTKGAVAVANRNARIAWAIMSSNDKAFDHALPHIEH